MRRLDPVGTLSSGAAKSSVKDERMRLQSVAEGNREDYRYFVDEHQAYVVNMIWRQTGDRSASEDLAQEAFLRAYKALPRFRFECSFKTWITRISLNLTSSYLSSPLHRDRLKILPMEGAGEQSMPCLSEQHDQKENMKQFRAALHALPSHYQGVVALVSLEGKSYEEASLILEIPIGTVRSRLNKARALLKEALETT
jgi:RNA polymerase sigma-70 factor (ECF subfamily)